MKVRYMFQKITSLHSHAKYRLILLMTETMRWIIKVKHLSLDTNEGNISLTKSLSLDIFEGNILSIKITLH